MTLFLQLLVNGIYVGSIYSLLGLSFAAIFSTSKVWHFAQGSIYSAAGLIILLLSNYTNIAVAVLLCIPLTAMAGWLCQTALYEPLLRRGTSLILLVMASLGVGGVVQNVMALIFGPSQQTLILDIGGPYFIGGVIVSTAQIIAPLIALVIVGIAVYIVKRTRSGRFVQALIVDEELLTLQGVSATPIRRISVMLGSAILPIPAGLLMLSGSGVSPYSGLSATLIGAMAVFLGGINSLGGAALGGLIIGITENLAVYFVPSEWQTAVSYTIFFAFILLRPAGLFGYRIVRTGL